MIDIRSNKGFKAHSTFIYCFTFSNAKVCKNLITTLELMFPKKH
jgi:hypothetical protein